MGRLVSFNLLIGLGWACSANTSASLERMQADNAQLTKTFHSQLNQRNWGAVSNLCAQTVRYRGRATHFAEVEESNDQFLARSRTTLTRQRPGSFQIRQLYTAGQYHVIVEGIAAGERPDTTVSICLIYTIENKHITRLYAY